MITKSPERINRERKYQEVFGCFLQSRKNEKTRDYSRVIIKYLSDRVCEDMQKPGNIQMDPYGDEFPGIYGWVTLTDLLDKLVLRKNEVDDYHKRQQIKPTLRGKEREEENKKMLNEMGKKIPNESTFYKLLKDLLKVELITKRTEERPEKETKILKSGRKPGSGEKYHKGMKHVFDKGSYKERKPGSGKLPTSYRIGIFDPCPLIMFMSRDELIKQHVELDDQMHAVKWAVSKELKDHPEIREKLDKSYRAYLEKIKKVKKDLYDQKRNIIYPSSHRQFE